MKEAEVFIGKMRTSWAQIDEKTKDTALCVLVGGVAFGSTLALSTFTQWRVLGITTGTPMPTPTLVGMASVCAASWVSHQAALFSHHCIAYSRLDPSQRQKSSLWHSWKEKEERALLEYQWINRNDFLDVSYFKVPWHTIRICTIGLVAFKLLGGRFWTIAPSTYTNLGAFARKSIPATERYASAAQRIRIERLGRSFGCHTCGSRARSFVGDHMPPRSVAEQLMRRRKWLPRPLRKQVQFRFYPQCVQCSGKQGGILSKATQDMRIRRRAIHQLHKIRDNAYFHGFQFRPVHHLVGGAVAASAVVGVSERDIENENRSRYARIHRQLDDRLQKTWKDAVKLVSSYR